MYKLHKIMVAVDFSPYSLDALNRAADIATDCKAELVLVNVVNQRDIDMMYRIEDSVPSFKAKERIEELKQDRIAQFQELLNQAECAHLSVATKVVSGVPYQALLKAIEQEKPDLLVMPTKGRGNLADTIIGSCAQKMFRRCPVPLLSVRPKPRP